MTNNSDGLSPQLRPQLGVGWGRALPAPFGFDNGIVMDGVNDYLTIPSFSGKPFFTNSFTFEVFFKDLVIPAYNRSTLLNMGMNSSTYPSLSYALGVNATRECVLQMPNPMGFTLPWTDAGVNHLVIAINPVTGDTSVHMNGGSLNGGYTLNTSFTNIFNYAGLLITNFYIGFYAQQSNAYLKAPITHYRFYNKFLSPAQVSLNWNKGVGNNPFETEHLLLWYKFLAFENLDFSVLQDGSDMRLGIRDFSGKNNHAQPINMDTNPASPTYVLKPF